MLEFFVTNSNLLIVFLGATLLSITCSIIGTFNFLQKKSLVGDAVSHSTLAGICLAFVITGNKNIFILLIGGAISAFFWLYILKKIPLNSKISEDPATAIVLATSFSFGIMILSGIQKTGNSSQAGLNNFLLGKIASLLEKDLYTIIFLSILIVFLFFILLKEFTIVSFDREYANSVGLKVRSIELVFTFLSVFTIVVGVRIVGILLISAMLITPSVAAKFWTKSLKKMLLISSIIGIFSSLVGVFISYKYANMPSGPCIVVAATIFAYISFLFSPKQGYVFRYFSQKRHEKKVLTENILKMIYEKKISIGVSYDNFCEQLLLNFNISKKKAKTTLIYLFKKKLLANPNNQIETTILGQEEGKRVFKMHILWEAYLSKYLKIKQDHVHDDAEGIEHILTPEIVKELENILNLNF